MKLMKGKNKSLNISDNSEEEEINKLKLKTYIAENNNELLNRYFDKVKSFYYEKDKFIKEKKLSEEQIVNEELKNAIVNFNTKYDDLHIELKVDDVVIKGDNQTTMQSIVVETAAKIEIIDEMKEINETLTSYKSSYETLKGLIDNQLDEVAREELKKLQMVDPFGLIRMKEELKKKFAEYNKLLEEKEGEESMDKEEDVRTKIEMLAKKSENKTKIDELEEDIKQQLNTLKLKIKINSFDEGNAIIQELMEEINNLKTKLDNTVDEFIKEKFKSDAKTDTDAEVDDFIERIKGILEDAQPKIENVNKLMKLMEQNKEVETKSETTEEKSINRVEEATKLYGNITYNQTKMDELKKKLNDITDANEYERVAGEIKTLKEEINKNKEEIKTNVNLIKEEMEKLVEDNEREMEEIKTRIESIAIDDYDTNKKINGVINEYNDENDKINGLINKFVNNYNAEGDVENMKNDENAIKKNIEDNKKRLTGINKIIEEYELKQDIEKLNSEADDLINEINEQSEINKKELDLETDEYKEIKTKIFKSINKRKRKFDNLVELQDEKSKIQKGQGDLEKFKDNLTKWKEKFDAIKTEIDKIDNEIQPNIEKIKEIETARLNTMRDEIKNLNEVDTTDIDSKMRELKEYSETDKEKDEITNKINENNELVKKIQDNNQKFRKNKTELEEIFNNTNKLITSIFENYKQSIQSIMKPVNDNEVKISVMETLETKLNKEEINMSLKNYKDKVESLKEINTGNKNNETEATNNYQIIRSMIIIKDNVSEGEEIVESGPKEIQKLVRQINENKNKIKEKLGELGKINEAKYENSSYREKLITPIENDIETLKQPMKYYPLK